MEREKNYFLIRGKCVLTHSAREDPVLILFLLRERRRDPDAGEEEREAMRGVVAAIVVVIVGGVVGLFGKDDAIKDFLYFERKNKIKSLNK